LRNTGKKSDETEEIAKSLKGLGYID
jgi:hypothetical protein